MPRLQVTVALASLALAGAPAAATQATHHKVVRRGGLDLTQNRDAQIMAKQIARAALEVCGGGDGHLDIVNGSILKSECWRDAVDRAASQLEAPRVSAALSSYRGR